MNMNNPWLTGTSYNGIPLQHSDAAGRLYRIKTMTPDELRAAIDWPSTQKTVRLAAERRLRKLESAPVGGRPRRANP